MITGRTNRIARARRRVAAMAAGLAVALSLTACGLPGSDPLEPSVGSNTQTTAPPKIPVPDACSLLTTSQIKAAANVVLSEGSPNAQLSSAVRSACDWETAGSASPFVQVLVTVGADSVVSERASAEASMGVGADVTVIGGGSAYAVANGSILGMRVADYFVQVTYLSGGGADVRVATTALAQNVANAL